MNILVGTGLLIRHVNGCTCTYMYCIISIRTRSQSWAGLVSKAFSI